MALFKKDGKLAGLVNNIKGSGIVASALSAIPVVGGIASKVVSNVNAKMAQTGANARSATAMVNADYARPDDSKTDIKKYIPHIGIGALVVAVIYFFTRKKSRR